MGQTASLQSYIQRSPSSCNNRVNQDMNLSLNEVEEKLFNDDKEEHNDDDDGKPLQRREPQSLG